MRKNIDERIYPASPDQDHDSACWRWKNGNLSDIVTIDEGALPVLTATAAPPVQVGEQLTFNDLLYCLMISSGNEAANAVAGAHRRLHSGFRAHDERAGL